MNGKKSSNLRKLIARNSNLPEVNYQEIKHKERLVQVGFKTDGSPRLQPHVPVTIALGECQRHYYQRAKVLHHLYRG